MRGRVEIRVWGAMLLLGAPLAAQELLSPGMTLRSETHLVMMYATVADSRRHPIAGLTPGQLSISDDEVAQKVAFFRQEDTPVALTLLIDNSGSMSTKRLKVEAAARAMLKICHPEDEVAVINFNDAVMLRPAYPFSRNAAEIAAKLVRTDSNGGSAIREALKTAVVNTNRKAALTKRVIVIVSDGEDNASEITQQDVIRLAQEANVLIYAIGFYDAGTSPLVLQRASKELRRIARETGGKAYYPSRKGVQKVAEEIAQEIRSQYVIGYYPNTPSMRDGRFHRIRVKLAGGVPASIRTRRGYYSVSGAE
ncbi:MAG: VWA domain-containing protein [Acidobacteria bacterium]|nr:VWA domain-containing protein [Acidobacteriota bacterium]